jgi:hypothetical protein
MISAPAPAPLAFEGPPDPDLIRIRDLIYQVAGIYHPDNKLRLLFDRCGRRMKEVKALTLRDYLDCLTVKPIRQTELIALLNEITIGETCFFRNQPQLDALRTIVIPKILEAKVKLPIRRLRIWSAGCSTGEEPYTLGMLLQEEANGRLKNWTFDIHRPQRALSGARQKCPLRHLQHAQSHSLLSPEIFRPGRRAIAGTACGTHGHQFQPAQPFR